MFRRLVEIVAKCFGCCKCSEPADDVVAVAIPENFHASPTPVQENIPSDLHSVRATAIGSNFRRPEYWSEQEIRAAPNYYFPKSEQVNADKVVRVQPRTDPLHVEKEIALPQNVNKDKKFDYFAQSRISSGTSMGVLPVNQSKTNLPQTSQNLFKNTKNYDFQFFHPQSGTDMGVHPGASSSTEASHSGRISLFDVDPSWKDVRAEDYREKARAHNKKMKQFQNAAKQYQKQNNKSMANHFFKLANEQKKQFHLSNDLAAVLFLEGNQQKVQKQNQNAIDLHYLHVQEAVIALDIFLDKGINSIREKSAKRRNLEIITGRGKHSADGIARVKPAVMARLRKRGLRFTEGNPGLLRTAINRNTKLTTELDL